MRAPEPIRSLLWHALILLLAITGCAKPVAFQPAPEERAVVAAQKSGQHGATIPSKRQRKTASPATSKNAHKTEKKVAARSSIPDFSSIRNTARRKRAFFDWLQPIIDKENQRIAEQRRQLLRIQNARRLNRYDNRLLNQLAREYRLENRRASNDYLIRKLLLRVDEVPAELVAAQAAIESAWGQSRFAREGNNLFGEWCFSKGCGIVPRRREAGARHEVRRFASPAESVRAYLHNINTRKDYTLLRRLRHKERQLHQPLSGYELALGLRSYSERGMAYVRQVRRLINSHRTLFASNREAD